ncbi:hypothetical protein SKAU_G00166990 [Synaphobranchus kaupii]|uniref:Uncharacterized protein n=1 Tax=Synaphobranchus kaupii TaxID=118154 RepID=A0A9Q1FK35_SYNKA|nr:hypothetical protein SKAU_G00166990 [Synaphobranchus kaupii]
MCERYREHLTRLHSLFPSPLYLLCHNRLEQGGGAQGVEPGLPGPVPQTHRNSPCLLLCSEWWGVRGGGWVGLGADVGSSSSGGGHSDYAEDKGQAVCAVTAAVPSAGEGDFLTASLIRLPAELR